MRPFSFTGWTKFQDQPLAHPGKLFDRTDNDGHSGVPQGGPAPYGRMLVRGLGVTGFGLTDRHFTTADAVSLPDIDGAYLINPDSGNTYATDGLTLPVGADGLLIPAGIGIWTEHNGHGCAVRLTQPWGLDDYYYQPECQGQVGMAQEGNIWAYCETDMNVGDDIFFRTRVTSTTDGIQLLGSFSNVGGGDFQQYRGGEVFRPGPAGGAFVITLNQRK